jgi:hypothetical protein
MTNTSRQARAGQQHTKFAAAGTDSWSSLQADTNCAATDSSAMWPHDNRIPTPSCTHLHNGVGLPCFAAVVGPNQVWVALRFSDHPIQRCLDVSQRSLCIADGGGHLRWVPDGGWGCGWRQEQAGAAGGQKVNKHDVCNQRKYAELSSCLRHKLPFQAGEQTAKPSKKNAPAQSHPTHCRSAL